MCSTSVARQGGHTAGVGHCSLGKAGSPVSVTASSLPTRRFTWWGPPCKVNAPFQEGGVGDDAPFGGDGRVDAAKEAIGGGSAGGVSRTSLCACQIQSTASFLVLTRAASALRPSHPA
eukprot:1342561-Pyramimonas_sp.AAC.1